ncbi:hypothetical protein YC2023_035538 [Brassica napus]
MYPRFAFGHMTPYLHLANKLAEKGNRITFLLPKKAQKLLEHLSLFPQHIVFHPLTIPHVDGLPPGAQTASDITVSLGKFLTKPWTSHVIRSKLRFSFETRPAYSLVPNAEPEVAPQAYPSSKVTFRFKNCDIISSRTCQDIKGQFCDFIELQYQKKVLLTGPMLPELDKTIALENQWNHWLRGFEPGSVVFCALGSQINIETDQFQELCLGMELTGLPFLVAKEPHEVEGLFVQTWNNEWLCGQVRRSISEFRP